MVLWELDRVDTRRVGVLWLKCRTLQQGIRLDSCKKDSCTDCARVLHCMLEMNHHSVMPCVPNAHGTAWGKGPRKAFLITTIIILFLDTTQKSST